MDAGKSLTNCKVVLGIQTPHQTPLAVKQSLKQTNRSSATPNNSLKGEGSSQVITMNDPWWWFETPQALAWQGSDIWQFSILLDVLPATPPPPHHAGPGPYSAVHKLGSDPANRAKL